MFTFKNYLPLRAQKNMTEAFSKRPCHMIFMLSYFFSFVSLSFFTAVFAFLGEVVRIFPEVFLGDGTFFSAFFLTTVLPSVFAKRFWNFSTLPAVSISFCLPVKNGWQLEHISSLMAGFVERVLKV
jgi:hypothetical protein